MELQSFSSYWKMIARWVFCWVSLFSLRNEMYVASAESPQTQTVLKCLTDTSSRPEWTDRQRFFTTPDEQQISNGWQISYNWIIYHQPTHLFWVMGKLISKNDTEKTPRQALWRFMWVRSETLACTYWLFSPNALSFNQEGKVDTGAHYSWKGVEFSW